MKKKIFAIFLSFVLVFSIALGGYFLVDLNLQNQNKTFSNTCNLTQKVDKNMDRVDIASLYINSCVSVYVETKDIGYSVGSGTCVAAKGYKTSSGYVAQRGAYFVTNYHVISNLVEEDYAEFDSKAYIILNSQDSLNKHECKLIWQDKDVDMALLYCDDNLVADIDNFGWIEIKDRTIDCEDNQRLNFDRVFTIGTPLNLEYQNTLALGYLSNQRLKESYTSKELFVYNSGSSYKFTTNERVIPNRQTLYYYDVLNNAYQDLIMMNLDITNGNSGGAVFDESGYIVGLSTLGINYQLANTSALNFAVPIYPLTKVLDKAIEFNEGASQTHNIIKIQDLNIYGGDVNELAFMYDFGAIKETGEKSYYFDGRFYNAQELNKYKDYEGEGFVVFSSEGEIEEGFIITSIIKDDVESLIKDRNDLIYFLYSCEKGDEITLKGNDFNSNLQEKSYIIEL